jgi:predicted nucleotidyltransferase
MKSARDNIEALATRYGLRLIYAFGSRAREALEFLDGRKLHLTSSASDLDIGVKSSTGLAVADKVDLALRLEELFGVSRVDLIVLSEVSTFLALEIVSGELLFAQDPHYEAEYQLYIMRKAAELMPFQRTKEHMMLGINS